MWSGSVRGFPLLGAVLTLSLLAILSSSIQEVAAQPSEPVYFNAIYFPWVPNNGETDNNGGWHGSITIQNIDVERENLGVRFWVFDGPTINRIALNDDGLGGPYSLGDALDDPAVPSFDLDPNASVTLGPGILGLPEPGSPVVVVAVYKYALDPNTESRRAPTIAGLQKQASPVPMNGATTTSAHVSVDGYSAIPFPDIAWGSQSDFCYQLRGGEADSCDGTGLHRGEGTPEGGFDGHSYLPIVQTNSGWDTEIYLSNVDFTMVSAAQVSLTLTRSQTRDARSSEVVQAVETVNIPPGGTTVINVRDLVGDEWVGSARITSTVGIASLAMRSKPAANMLMINTSVPSLHQTTGDEIPVDLFSVSSEPATYHQYAPLVFRDYNGWNTGFSFVNIAETPNRVTVSYIAPEGHVTHVDTRTVPARGHEFIYIPATRDLGVGEGFAGAAHFQADHPFHVAIDQVKYETGEAMSYLAVGAGVEVGDALLLPLVQKGWLDGSGDTSGIQLFNPSTTSSVLAELRFFDSAGTAINPTRIEPIPVRLGPRETSTLYTPNLSGMPQNQRASAVLIPVEGDGWIVGISNNVNYAVSGDGSSVFQMVNVRGQYRHQNRGAISE